MFGHKHEAAPPAVTSMYQMRQKMLSIGDDYWIENGVGQKAFHVDGKKFRLRKTFIFEDASGDELLRIHSKILHVRDTFVIEREDAKVATLHKNLIGFRDRFAIDLGGAGELHAHGKILDHEYAIRRDDTEIAQINKNWMRLRDTYGVSIVQDEDIPLLLAIVTCIDAISHQHR